MLLRLANVDVECHIIDDVQEVKSRIIETGERVLEVQYRSVNRGLTGEMFVLSSTAFLMNESGKTIETFHPTETKP